MSSGVTFIVGVIEATGVSVTIDKGVFDDVAGIVYVAVGTPVTLVCTCTGMVAV